MRFRLMYLFSFLLSAVAMWFFKTESWAMNLIRGLSGMLVGLGIALSLCFIALTAMGSGASLRRTRKYGKTIGKSIAWTLLLDALTLALAFAAGMFLFKGSDFSLTMKDASLVSVSPLADASSLASLAGVFGTQQYLYLGVFFGVVLCLLFSYYLNPTLKVIQPAYALANSINEVGFRFFYTVCNAYIVFLFIISGAFFARVFDSGSELMTVASSSRGLLVKMGAFHGVLCLVLFPIVFLLFTKFRQNPFPVIWSAFITSLVAVFSGNLLFSVPVMEEIHRHQNNSLKRTTVVSGDLMYLLSRAGSAAMAYLVILSLCGGASMVAQVEILCICFVVSLFSGLFPGLEYLLSVAVARIAMPDLISDDVMIIAAAYAPMLGAMGLFTDAFAINFGTKACDIPIAQTSEND